MSKLKQKTQNYTISFTTTGKKEKQPIKYLSSFRKLHFIFIFSRFPSIIGIIKKISYSINFKNYLMLIKLFPP